jgi:hypothetical protein
LTGLFTKIVLHLSLDKHQGCDECVSTLVPARKAGDPEAPDPRAVDTLIRISERVAKLHGLDAPTKIEATGADGGPIQTQKQEPDFSKFSHDEMLIFAALHAKAAGDPNWDQHIRYYGTEMGERTNLGRLIVAFVKALPAQGALTAG